MVGSLYDALRSANVDDAKARTAAEDVADFDKRVNGFERELGSIKGELNLLKWMVGFNLAVTVAVLFRQFTN